MQRSEAQGRWRRVGRGGADPQGQEEPEQACEAETLFLYGRHFPIR
jgi:hypothetical protein